MFWILARAMAVAWRTVLVSCALLAFHVSCKWLHRRQVTHQKRLYKATIDLAKDLALYHQRTRNRICSAICAYYASQPYKFPRVPPGHQAVLHVRQRGVTNTKLAIPTPFRRVIVSPAANPDSFLLGTAPLPNGANEGSGGDEKKPVPPSFFSNGGDKSNGKNVKNQNGNDNGASDKLEGDDDKPKKVLGPKLNNKKKNANANGNGGTANKNIVNSQGNLNANASADSRNNPNSKNGSAVNSADAHSVSQKGNGNGNAHKNPNALGNSNHNANKNPHPSQNQTQNKNSRGGAGKNQAQIQNHSHAHQNTRHGAGPNQAHSQNHRSIPQGILQGHPTGVNYSWNFNNNNNNNNIGYAQVPVGVYYVPATQVYNPNAVNITNPTSTYNNGTAAPVTTSSAKRQANIPSAKGSVKGGKSKKKGPRAQNNNSSSAVSLNNTAANNNSNSNNFEKPESVKWWQRQRFAIYEQQVADFHYWISRGRLYLPEDVQKYSWDLIIALERPTETKKASKSSSNKMVSGLLPDPHVTPLRMGLKYSPPIMVYEFSKNGEQFHREIQLYEFDESTDVKDFARDLKNKHLPEMNVKISQLEKALTLIQKQGKADEFDTPSSSSSSAPVMLPARRGEIHRSGTPIQDGPTMSLGNLVAESNPTPTYAPQPKKSPLPSAHMEAMLAMQTSSSPSPPPQQQQAFNGRAEVQLVDDGVDLNKAEGSHGGRVPTESKAPR